MAAIAKLKSSRHVAFQLTPVLPYGDHPTIRLVTQHTTAATTAGGSDTTFSQKQDLAFAPDNTDIEHINCALSDFSKAYSDALLKLHDTECHKKASEVLGGDRKVIWDDTINVSTNKLDADFPTNVCAFLSDFLPSNYFLVQQEYLHGAAKSFHMTCFNVASCLRLINSMSIYLPGSGGSQLLVGPTAMQIHSIVSCSLSDNSMLTPLEINSTIQLTHSNG